MYIDIYIRLDAYIYIYILVLRGINQMGKNIEHLEDKNPFFTLSPDQNQNLFEKNHKTDE